MRGMVSARIAAKLSAIVLVIPFLGGCAQLHLTQAPNQVIQRTEGEDNYDSRQKAGPTAARVLPYALLAEQSYNESVYRTHRMGPRSPGCVSDDPKDCDSLGDSRRVAA